MCQLLMLSACLKGETGGFYRYLGKRFPDDIILMSLLSEVPGYSNWGFTE